MRKTSAKKAAKDFRKAVGDVTRFTADMRDAGLSAQYVSWVHEYAIIRVYRDFEKLILKCLIAAVNNDTAQLSLTTGIAFPRHLTDKVCEYLIVGDGYFDFKGRDGLIQSLKRFVGDTHYLVALVKKPEYKDTLERLSALRNFAAHNSAPSKKRALRALGLKRMSSCGNWLKSGNRLETICAKLENLADGIVSQAPY